MNLGDFGPDSSSNDNESNTGFLAPGESVRYQLTETEREHARKIAQARHQSYSSGETRDEDWADSLAVMERGTTAELVAALLYSECSFDDYVGPEGDDDSDGQLRIDSDVVDIDIKAGKKLQSNVPYDVELLVAQHHIEERDEPPVFVSAYVSESLDEVRLRGWAWTDDLVESGLKPAYSGSHQNYTRSVDDLTPMPEPDCLNEHDGAEIVRE